MTYASSLGSLAKNRGMYCLYMATASRRALDTSCALEVGRIGKIMETLSSVARISVAISRNALARNFGFWCAVAKYASANTRSSTISALGRGMSSGADAVSLAISPCCTPDADCNLNERHLRFINVNVRQRAALLASTVQ